MALGWLELQHRAQQEFGKRVRGVTDWSAPTPDTDWDTADLVRHVIVEQQWVPPLLGGLTLAEAAAHVRPLGDDLASEWAQYSGRAVLAWSVASPSAPVHLSYGTVTVDEYLHEQVADLAIHSWDLARAAGMDESLDARLVAAVWEELDERREMLSASGLFASPVPVADDAPLQTRLLALTGRDDRSTPPPRPTGGR
ncbi:TIGR03086 family metal-binding protein [Rhodococcus tukisamuensis]|uniref:TIGR03086 family protein n=1 Tax=Rhodococcus tukisamuensis TaxID=168276 RepID=A0A1G6SBL0_9NOCA|nr:TIGR03086 family metal-binding protein [Rhodococcus tukisamuensis]SDD14278.1 TIGR03086 family protein [Rhodococcus tukisamuensis]